MRKFHILNGPNLNLLGSREPEIYGRDSLADVEALCRQIALANEVELVFRQTNHEGVMIDWIHEARAEAAAGIVINPAAWTHTSVALRDALSAAEVPFWEVHISNVHAREAFRHHSYLSAVAQGVICGCGIRGYEYALIEAIRHTG